MRIGLLGGTFDPVHYGHLFLAEECRTRLHLDQVILIPAGSPPHKQRTSFIAAEHRLAMVKLAIASNPSFACSDMEIRRGGISYTVDTLRALREQRPGAEMYYLTGIDTVAEIGTWKCPDEVLRLATFVAVTRPGYDPALLDERLPPEYLARVQRLDTIHLDISSTEIRHRVAEGAAIRYLLPDAVAEYISTHSLYGADHARCRETGETK